MQKLTTEEFINRAIGVHNTKYDYSKVKYTNSNSPVVIVCPEHGDFKKNAGKHMEGAGCPKCSHNYKPTTSEFIEKAKKIHKDKYTYEKTLYRKAHSKVIITCPIHGDFQQTPTNHLSNFGCIKCGTKVAKQKQTSTTEIFIRKAKTLKGPEYDYSKSKYISAKSNIEIICRKHGSFYQIVNNHLRGWGCPKCNNTGTSKLEQELLEFLKQFDPKGLNNYRDIPGVSEVDFYSMKNKIAIEFNGLYWHSDKFKDKNYHLDKTTACEALGITLIHIFEDEWVHKQEIVKSRLRNLFSKTKNRVYARKTEVKLVPTKEKTKFLDTNHIQGAVGSSINLGLYYKDELVSIMTFGPTRINLGYKNCSKLRVELLRFCNKVNHNVIGGASKLLKYFESNYKYQELISYADRRWSTGGLYKTLGFEFAGTSSPNYFYHKSSIERLNRFKFRKNILVQEGFDPNKTERQIMEEQGYNRIYDCGTLKFIKQNGKEISGM